MRRSALTAVLVCAAGVLGSSAAHASSTGAWAPGPTYPWERKQTVTVAAPNGHLFVFGGFNGANAVSQVYELDPLLQTWTQRASMPVATQGACGGLVDDDTIVIVGGIDGTLPTDQINATQIYSISGNSWTQGTDRNTGWECAAAADDQGLLHVFGGESDLIGHASYDHTTDTWQPLPGMPTQRQGHGVFFAPNGTFVVFGGGNDMPSNTTQIFDPMSGLWSDGPNMPGSAIHFGYASNGLDAFVFGGSTVNANDQPPFFDSVWIYDGEAGTWSTSPFTLDIPIRENSGAYADGRLYSICGSDGARRNFVQVAFVDSDDDSFFDIGDNCPFVINVAQENADGDAFGNVCDACPLDALDDTDSDGLCANVDNCPFDANPTQTDTDDDGIGDACDDMSGTTSAGSTTTDSGGSTSGDGSTGAVSSTTTAGSTGSDSTSTTSTSSPSSSTTDDSGTTTGDGTGSSSGSTSLPPFTTAADTDTDTTGGASGDDDGCGCRSTRSGSTAWWLLLPLLMRRRRRCA